MTAPRGLSQPPTSFIGSQCQGIHHAPLNTYNTKTNMRLEKLHINNTKKPTPDPKAGVNTLRARCSQPLSTNQTPHPTTKDGATTTHPPNRGATPPPVPPTTGRRDDGLVVSKPNSVFSEFPARRNPGPAHVCCAPEPDTHYRRRPIQRIAQVRLNPHDLRAGHESRGAP